MTIAHQPSLLIGPTILHESRFAMPCGTTFPSILSTVGRTPLVWLHRTNKWQHGHRVGVRRGHERLSLDIGHS